jgi:hypothetical protein
MVSAMPLSPSEMARRAFWSRLYARRRLGTERAQALAPLHYALVGERLGYRPNGFFDPKFFRQAAGFGSSATGLMQRYLARPESGAPSPSAEFDHAWYVSQNPEWSSSHSHPFLHFLEVGLQTGRRPRSDIDMAFVRDVIRSRGRSIEEAALRVFDPKRRDGDLKPPLSLQELRARQERFYASGRMRIEREASDRGRKLLVFVQCGEGFDASYLREPRGYDVLLNYFDESEPNPLGDTVLYQAGTKTTSARRLLELRPDLLLRYEAALFLDDDVEIRAEDIDALFATMAREGLDLAQPALTADSKSAWPYLKRPNAEHATFRVSSVEIMAPVFTRRALQRLGWVFAEAAGGWGTDLLLGPAARAAFGPDRIGVVGAVAVRHTRPVDTRNGALYAYLRRNGIDPAHEANQIVAEFGVERFLRRLAPGETGPVCRLPEGERILG